MLMYGKHITPTCLSEIRIKCIIPGMYIAGGGEILELVYTHERCAYMDRSRMLKSSSVLFLRTGSRLSVVPGYGRRVRGEGYTHLMHSRSRITIVVRPSHPYNAGWSISGLHSVH